MAVNKRNDELVDMLTADFLRNKMPIVCYGTVGGFWDGDLSISSDTTITLLGGGTDYSVVRGIRFWSITYGAAGFTVTDNTVVPSALTELHNDGTNVVEIRVTAAGAIEVQRTAGTATIAVKMRIEWL